MTLYGSGLVWHSTSMPTKTEPEPKPFEKFQQFAAKVLSVPKKEIDRREAEYQKQRVTKRHQDKAAH